jgi:hypothetical protein
MPVLMQLSLFSRRTQALMAMSRPQVKPILLGCKPYPCNIKRINGNLPGIISSAIFGINKSEWHEDQAMHP